MRVWKGHGTGNDFVVLPDLEGSLVLTPLMVQALCDRHTGIGADGVLRVVRSENDPVAKAMAVDAPYFMDYRNADGSTAEMCGNGARVFLRYLQAAGLVEVSTALATRGGVKQVSADAGDTVTVEMGEPGTGADALTVRVRDGVAHRAAWVTMPNPHAVVPVETEAELNSLDLTSAPQVEPPRPDGQNVEFVFRAGPRHLVMRVFERGVGETHSCGTGVCAVVVAAAQGDGSGPDGRPWRVDVPGGTCEVIWRDDGMVLLRGPAVLVGAMDVDPAWLAAAIG